MVLRVFVEKRERAKVKGEKERGKVTLVYLAEDDHAGEPGARVAGYVRVVEVYPC